MAKVYNENLLPTGGWFFRDHTGVNHTGSSLRALINTVRSYRELNKIEIGDVESEVVEQLCARDPAYCREPSQRPPPTPSVTPRNFVSTMSQKVSSWVSQMFADKRMGRVRKVSSAQMRERAAICSRCPKQISYPSACGGCKDNLNRLSAEIVAPDNSEPVQCCSVLAEWTPVSTWLDLPPEPNSELPIECWRKLK